MENKTVEKCYLCQEEILLDKMGENRFIYQRTMHFLCFKCARKISHSMHEILNPSQKLLAKYIKYVRQCEGIDFIDGGYRGYDGDIKFTTEEWEDLVKISKEY